MGAEFDGKKIVVVGGSAGIGCQAALDVIDRGGRAVIIGRSEGRVDDTVAELTGSRLPQSDAASIDSAARHLLDATDRQPDRQDASTTTAQRRSAAPVIRVEILHFARVRAMNEF
jgi:NAD(P)-dependent dehydrogenase (short-subunit alcohol dehydrogenase family)